MMDGSEISPLPRPPETESRCRDIKEMAIVRLASLNFWNAPVVGLNMEFSYGTKGNQYAK